MSAGEMPPGVPRPPLPERIEGEDLLLRRWTPEDAGRLADAVSESVPHLRPWMEWVSEEPVALERRREMIRSWEERWRAGGDLNYGIFLDERVAGGCGLHSRLGESGLEIGYWVHPGFLRRGVATRAAALLTGAAFTLPWIDYVEIHHDKANVASGGVPRKLGFVLVGESRDEPSAPAEVGIECRWQMTRERWARLTGGGATPSRGGGATRSGGVEEAQ